MPISATLAIDEVVARHRADGRRVVPCGFGEAGLPVLPELIDRLAGAAGEAAYGPVAGIATLREAAAGYWERRGLATDPGSVVAGPGSKPLLYAIIEAVGGGLALPCPSWVSYAAQGQLLHREVHLIPIEEPHGGVPDPERLAVAARRARRRGRPIGAVVVTLPDNPTGTLADADRVAALCRVAREEDLVVIADEIYRDLVHDPAAPFISPAQLAPERTVVTTGLSKSLALGGWRTGVLRLPEGALGRRLHHRLTEVASELWSSAPMPVQHAAAWAFEEPEVVRVRIAHSRRLHARVVGAVARRFRAAGARVAPLGGGFYLAPDLSAMLDPAGGSPRGITSATALAGYLLERYGLATLPGSAFGLPDERLSLRVATSLLYGDTATQRLAALEADDPTDLPWIAAHLHDIEAALTDLVAAPHAPTARAR